MDFSGRFPSPREFFSKRIRNEHTVLIFSPSLFFSVHLYLSLFGIKNAESHPLSGQTFLYERALGCKLVSTRATSTSLHVRWSAREPRYIRREFEASFSDSNRVESELPKPSYQSGSRCCRIFRTNKSCPAFSPLFSALFSPPPHFRSSISSLYFSSFIPERLITM